MRRQMSKIDYAELRRLEQAATPGPWSAESCGNDACWCQVISDGTDVGVAPSGAIDRCNAGFIAAARNALPAILDRLEKLEVAAEAARIVMDSQVGYGEFSAACDQLRECLAALDSDDGGLNEVK